MNLGISILSSRYDSNEELAEREFLRERCAIIGAFMGHKVTNLRLPRFVFATQRALASDEQEESIDDALRGASRLHSLKQHTKQQVLRVERQLLARIEELEGNQGKLLQRMGEMEENILQALARHTETVLASRNLDGSTSFV